MVVRKDDIHNLVDLLPEHYQKTVFDFLQYLIDRSEKKPTGWAETSCNSSVRRYQNYKRALGLISLTNRYIPHTL